METKENLANESVPESAPPAYSAFAEPGNPPYPVQHEGPPPFPSKPGDPPYPTQHDFTYPEAYPAQPPPPSGPGSYPPPSTGYPMQGAYPPQGAHPPQGAYPPQGDYPMENRPMHAGQTVVVGPTVTTFGHFGSYPVQTTCPSCHTQITTEVTYEIGAATWLVAGGLCFFGCCLGCCLIPFCTHSLKDAKHTCPNCKKVVGKFARM